MTISLGEINFFSFFLLAIYRSNCSVDHSMCRDSSSCMQGTNEDSIFYRKLCGFPLSFFPPFFSFCLHSFFIIWFKVKWCFVREKKCNSFKILVFSPKVKKIFMYLSPASCCRLKMWMLYPIFFSISIAIMSTSKRRLTIL